MKDFLHYFFFLMENSWTSGTVSDDGYRWLLLRAREMEIKTAMVASLFKEVGIDAIIFKGWSIARFYPEMRPRYYTDVDIAVPSTEYDHAMQVAAGKDTSGIVDVHREFRHLAGVSWDALMSRSEVVKIDGTPVRVLSPEDELRVVCTHWLNDGGASKDRLWDIHYAVENGPAGFDWDLCLHGGGENRGRWVALAIRLAERYTGLNIERLPQEISNYRIPGWVVRTLEREWKSGVPLLPLLQCRSDPKMLMKQLRKRLPPNPIEATIEMNGEIDGYSRPVYQVQSALKRLGPSVRKLQLFISMKRHQ